MNAALTNKKLNFEETHFAKFNEEISIKVEAFDELLNKAKKQNKTNEMKNYIASFLNMLLPFGEVN